MNSRFLGYENVDSFLQNIGKIIFVNEIGWDVFIPQEVTFLLLFAFYGELATVLPMTSDMESRSNFVEKE